jgi:hypothetical protein
MQGKPVALYWKNGSEITIQDPSDSGGWTNSVFINFDSANETSRYLEGPVRTWYFQNETDEKPGRSGTSGGLFSFIFKHPGKTHKQSNTTVKKAFNFPRIRIPDLFPNHEKNNFARLKRK